MRDLTFTLYPDAFSARGKSINQSWTKWIAAFSKHAHRGDASASDDLEALDRAKNGPAVILGEVPDGVNRSKNSVKKVDALALDLDDLEEKGVVDTLQHLDSFEYVVHTTHKHGSGYAAGKPRLRVILPLVESLAPSDFPGAWRQLNEYSGNVNDPTTKDICRLNFLPSTFDPSIAWAIHHPGELLDISKLPESSTQSGSISGVDIGFLEKFRGRLRQLPKDHELKDAMKALIAGGPFAKPGARHVTQRDLTRVIAEKNSALNRETLEALFRNSLEAMAAEAGSPPTPGAIWTAYEGAVKFFKETREEKRRDAQTRGKTPYTKEEIAKMAARHGWAPDQLQQCWIIQSIGGGWIMGEGGRYYGPVTKDEFAVEIRQRLARSPVRLVEIGANGYPKTRAIVDVVVDSGTVAQKIISDLQLQTSTFDPETATMIEAVTPLRKIVPKYDPLIDQWLRVFAGKNYGKIVDWMSVCSDLSKLLCALYLKGGKKSGKTLFAHGMARLWTDGSPADLKQVLGDFNEELTRCPLIFADEKMPKIKWGDDVTSILRNMLSVFSRPLMRKYRAPSDLKGAVRVVMAANNRNLLNTTDVAEPDDLAAIAERFLYVPVSEEASDFLKEGVPKAVKHRWGEEGIAAHALWLAKNHTIENPGDRFEVEGSVSEMHRLLMTGSFWNSRVCEFLVNFLLNPQKLTALQAGGVRIHKGKLLANPNGIGQNWGVYFDKSKVEPETPKIGLALRTISSGPRVQQRWQGRREWYRVIDLHHLLAWAQENDLADEESLFANLGGEAKGENVIDFPKGEDDGEPAGVDDEGNLKY